MFGINDTATRVVIAGLFWEPFDAAKAETALFRCGFTDHDIDVIGVLSGHEPDISSVLFAMGITREDAIFYNDCFADGAVLVMVRTESARRVNIARRALKQHGGVFAPTESSSSSILSGQAETGAAVS